MEPGHPVRLGAAVPSRPNDSQRLETLMASLKRTVSIRFPFNEKSSDSAPRKAYDGPASLSMAEHRPRPPIAEKLRSSGPRGGHQLPFRGDVT